MPLHPLRPNRRRGATRPCWGRQRDGGRGTRGPRSCRARSPRARCRARCRRRRSGRGRAGAGPGTRRVRARGLRGGSSVGGGRGTGEGNKHQGGKGKGKDGTHTAREWVVKERGGVLTIPESAKCSVCLSASLTLSTSTVPPRCLDISLSRSGVTLMRLRSSQRIRERERAMRSRSRSVMNSCPTSPSRRTGRAGSTHPAAIALPRNTCRAGSASAGRASGS